MQPQVHSPYLVERMLSRGDENIFNHVKFRLVAEALRRGSPARPKVLDLGCAHRIGQRYLHSLGFAMEYFGVDYEPSFQPDLVADLRDPALLREQLPWTPDAIMLLDVLEHLDGQEADIRRLLSCCQALLPPHGRLLVTIPQLYRLDRFKLPHLHYAEHKIRLTAEEWRGLLSERFEVLTQQGIGYLSTLPYLVMFSRRYRDQNHLGRLFRHLRERTLERPLLRSLDLQLSQELGARAPFRDYGNDVLFVCRQRAQGEVAR